MHPLVEEISEEDLHTEFEKRIKALDMSKKAFIPLTPEEIKKRTAKYLDPTTDLNAHKKEYHSKHECWKCGYGKDVICVQHNRIACGSCRYCGCG